MSAPTRPLPESLTRLLNGPAAPVVSPTQRSAAAGTGRFLETAVLKGFVFAVSGLVWAAIAWRVVRHVLRWP